MPDAWGIEITGRARKDLADLPSREREAVGHSINRLGREPARTDIKKLAGDSGEWRLRSGALRILFAFDSPNHMITILRVLPRGRAYRRSLPRSLEHELNLDGAAEG